MITQNLKNTGIITEDEPNQAKKCTKASSWQNSTYWTNLSEFHADGFAYIWCWIKLLLGVWMTVDIVLDVLQTIKYFKLSSLVKDKQTKCKDTQNIIKGVLTIIFVVAINLFSFAWTGSFQKDKICLKKALIGA